MNEFQSYLQKYLRIWPPHMAVIRAFESVYLKENVTMSPPFLDLGCGDGQFIASVFGKVDVGIDISAKEIRRASRSGAFSCLHCVDGHTIPYPDGYFKTIISNCVIEHVSQPDNFIHEIARVLDIGGIFVFSTWTPDFNTALLLRKKWYISWKSSVLAHRSIKSVNEWKTILQRHSLEVTFIKHYLAPSSIKFLDFLELLSLIGFWKFNLLNFYRLVAPSLANVIIMKIAQSLDTHINKQKTDVTACGVIIKAIKDSKSAGNSREVS